jgi:hypothetical protein
MAAITILGLWTAVMAATGIDRVIWLQGCWEMASGNRTIEEQWTAPRGGIMLEVGRTVRDGRLVEYEFVVVREDGEQLAYEAHPSGQPPAVFRSRDVSDRRVVFENPEHDFPQRVGYERKSADALAAWIEGTMNGRERRVDFAYHRVACP